MYPPVLLTQFSPSGQGEISHSFISSSQKDPWYSGSQLHRNLEKKREIM